MNSKIIFCLIAITLAGCNTTKKGMMGSDSKQSSTTILLEQNCKNDEYILIKSKRFFANDILTNYGCKHNTKMKKGIFVEGKRKYIQAPSRDGKTYTKRELEEIVANDPNIGFGKIISETKTVIQR